MAEYDINKHFFRDHMVPEANEGLDVGLVGRRFRTVRAKSIVVDSATILAFVTGTLQVTSLTLGYAITDASGNFLTQARPLPAADLGSGPTANTVLHGNQAFSAVDLLADTISNLTVARGGTGATTFAAGYVKSPGGTGALTTQATPIPTADGGTGISSPTAHTLPIMEGASAFTLATLANGQLLIGSTGADPVVGAISVSAGLSITLGAGTIAIAGPTATTMQVFTSSTTYNTPAGLRAALVIVIGGGGGGGNAGASFGGGGGGGGGAALRLITAATLGGSQTVTIGAGGGAATGGGTTSFGALLSATGGAAGSSNTGAASLGGTGSTGTINFTGLPGGNSVGSAVGGAGGASALGYGPGGGGLSGSSNGLAGSLYGGGGGGSVTSPNTGGSGANGIVVVFEYY